MKIFFRYLFMRLLQTFLVVLSACTVIWVMADLYGNMDDFLDHKVHLSLVLYFYVLQIPKMLVQVLPATILFSTLFTLLSLNRRSELVALQAGGMAPIWMFSPFFLFALIWMGILAYDMNGPAAEAEVERDRVLAQVKGQAAGRNVFTNLPYIDNVNHRVWLFQSLDAKHGNGKGVEILLRYPNGDDELKYFAREGKWTGHSWQLTGVREILFAAGGGMLDQKVIDHLELPITTTPKQLSLIISQPPQLTVAQLSQYLATSTQSSDALAKYRTEWWYRKIYPVSILVMILFALIQGARTDRRSAVAGVGMAIIVLLAFTMASSVFMAMGRFDRLPPVVAVSITELIFGLIGLYYLASNNGWWWQLHELWKKWYDEDEDEHPAPPSETV